MKDVYFRVWDTSVGCWAEVKGKIKEEVGFINRLLVDNGFAVCRG